MNRRWFSLLATLPYHRDRESRIFAAVVSINLSSLTLTWNSTMTSSPTGSSFRFNYHLVLQQILGLWLSCLCSYYTTRLWIGTPPQEFALIVDTGSTVTYVPCSTCKQCGKHQVNLSLCMWLSFWFVSISLLKGFVITTVSGSKVSTRVIY